MFQNIIIKITFILLILANLLSVIWLRYEGGYEPAITSLLIFAAILGIFVERWIAQRNRRKELLYSLAHELLINIRILHDKIYSPSNEEAKLAVVYPRLVFTVVDSAISSGVFIEDKDKKLFNYLHTWRELTTEFNQRLMFTELAISSNLTPDNIKSWRTKLSQGALLKQVRDSAKNFARHLTDNYKKESGIDSETLLFDEPVE